MSFRIMSKRLSSEATHEFFERRDEQNKVKTQIVVDFFKGYVPIVLRGSAQVRYVDLFAGRGYYDGCNVIPSEERQDATPLAILRAVIADFRFTASVSGWFNEGNPKHYEDLCAAANALPGFNTLRHRPKFTNLDVSQYGLTPLFGQGENIPTFAFIDPYGYKGLTRELVAALLKDWGCDVAFFFNYRRVNMGLGHGLFDEHFAKIFGEGRLAQLRSGVEGHDPERREAIVVAELRNALHEIGARHVLVFRFRNADGRTSHHLVYASKVSRGYWTMREKMVQHSAKDREEIPYFDFVAGNPQAPTLFDTAVVMPPREWIHSVDFLARALLDEHRGFPPMTFKDLSQTWLLREELPYQEKHYRRALWRLRDQGHVRFDRAAGARQLGRNQVPTDTTITFQSE